MKFRKIISGGQTGADQGALSACVRERFPYGGWIPKGRRTEQGKVPDRYRMRQHASSGYAARTEANVRDSDCTVIFTYGKPKGGSKLTNQFARLHGRPCLMVDLDRPHDQVVAKTVRWLKRNCPENGVVNVAGSRRSKAPGIHMAVKRVIRDVLSQMDGSAADRKNQASGRSV